MTPILWQLVQNILDTGISKTRIFNANKDSLEVKMINRNNKWIILSLVLLTLETKSFAVQWKDSFKNGNTIIKVIHLIHTLTLLMPFMPMVLLLFLQGVETTWSISLINNLSIWIKLISKVWYLLLLSQK